MKTFYSVGSQTRSIVSCSNRNFHALETRRDCQQNDGIEWQFPCNYFTEMCSGSEEGSYPRLITLCVADGGEDIRVVACTLHCGWVILASSYVVTSIVVNLILKS